MAYVEVPVDVRARFEIDRLSIVAELVAAKHQFVFKGKNVAVSIPDKAGLPFDLQRLHLYKWRRQYAVRSLTVEMELTDAIDVPEEVRSLPPKQFELFQPNERDQLDRTLAEAGDELRAAFAYWLIILRWKSGIGYIGEPSINYGGDRQSAALCERGTGHRLHHVLDGLLGLFNRRLSGLNDALGGLIPTARSCDSLGIPKSVKL